MPNYRPPTSEPFRFGVFEIDPSTRELRKHGVRIKLQDQPFAVLLILLEKPGQLVTREELQQRLWPGDTFVEFDKGINNALILTARTSDGPGPMAVGTSCTARREEPNCPSLGSGFLPYRLRR